MRKYVNWCKSRLDLDPGGGGNFNEDSDPKYRLNIGTSTGI